MAENVALNKRKQKSFKTSVDKYKKLLKKGEIEIDENIIPISKKKHATIKRGVVYFSHIPHGFYETEMKSYFSQFGVVTRLRLARSPKTGKSKGYAFIEFREPEVAKIVAETMDNYLMCNRLLKAKYIPPEEQHQKYFPGKPFTETSYPKVRNRDNSIRRNRSLLSNDAEKKHCTNKLKHLSKVQKKLKGLGIDYDLKPVHTPEYLKIDNQNKTSGTDDSFQTNDDDDNVYITAPDIKQIVKLKSTKKKMSLKMPKTEHSSKIKSNKKLTTISKKSKMDKIDKNSKKFQLIQRGILSGDQTIIRKSKDINKYKKDDINESLSPKKKKSNEVKKSKKKNK